MKYNIRRICFKKVVKISYKVTRNYYVDEKYRPSWSYILLQDHKHLDKDYILEKLFEENEKFGIKLSDFNLESVVIRTLDEGGAMKSEEIGTVESDIEINKDKINTIDYEGSTYLYAISYDPCKNEYNITLDNGKDSDLSEIDEDFYEESLEFVRKNNIMEAILERQNELEQKKSKFKSFFKFLRS